MAACANEYPTRIERSEPTITTEGQSYAAGDQVGSLCTFDIVTEAGTKAGVKLSVIGVLNSTDTPALDIWFFEREPTTVSADDDPASFNESVLFDHFLGHVEVAATDWSSDANHSVFTKLQAMPIRHFQEGLPGRIWAAVIARSAFTPVRIGIGIGVTVD
jgi:hypothetical protein